MGNELLMKGIDGVGTSVNHRFVGESEEETAVEVAQDTEASIQLTGRSSSLVFNSVVSDVRMAKLEASNAWLQSELKMSNAKTDETMLKLQAEVDALKRALNEVLQRPRK
jgi:hypothetical protein